MSPPNYFRFFGKRTAKPEILTSYFKNVSSSFFSEISRTSTFPVNSLRRRSNLFCKELIFMWLEKCDSSYSFAFAKVNGLVGLISKATSQFFFSESLDSSIGVSM